MGGHGTIIIATARAVVRGGICNIFAEAVGVDQRLHSYRQIQTRLRGQFEGGVRGASVAGRSEEWGLLNCYELIGFLGSGICTRYDIHRWGRVNGISMHTRERDRGFSAVD